MNKNKQHKQQQLEENIARLVKTSGDSQLPSEDFTKNLIDKAVNELDPPKQAPKKQSSLSKVVPDLLKIAAVAAIVAFLVSALVPSLQKAKMYSPLANSKYLGGTNAAVDYYLGEAVSNSSAPPMAHGGTTPPNDQAADAMFFKNYGVNPFIDTEDDPLSTFAIDVDSGSYTVCRAYLNEGHLPPTEAVRVEEFINYFNYDYVPPQEQTFAAYVEAMPWSLGEGRKNSYLLRIGLKAKVVPDELRKPAILTFVIDISGSMDRQDRLGLVKESLRLLIDKLKPEDKIGIAVYGDRGRKYLDHTGLDEKDKILAAINRLSTNGSTNAEEGIRIGYQMAEDAFTKGCINRVILCSDGVANIGKTGPKSIMATIKHQADKGITLSSLGFGMGNYNDVLLEQLGDTGNGYYAYIDTLDEAKRLFSNLTGALQVVARDVKVQVAFNPEVVRSYRLIGYENRDVADEDFRNDKVDGGEIGAGHDTTALYELKLWPDAEGPIANTCVRYKDPDTFEPSEISFDFASDEIVHNNVYISPSFALAGCVTEFAEILRESYWAKGASLDDTLAMAQRLNEIYPDDPDVTELTGLIEKAKQYLEQNQENAPAADPSQVPAAEEQSFI